MFQGLNAKINVKLFNDSSGKSKNKKISIDFNTLKSFDEHNSLLSIISKEYQIEITKKHFEVEILYIDKWIILIDLHSFLFFISSNILTEDETKIRITYKGSCKTVEYEDEDMIRANELDMAIYKDKKTIVKCGICHQLSSNEFYIHRLGPFYGGFKHCNEKYYIHLICALWCPQVCISKKNRLLNVAKEIHRAKREKCSYCGDSGAALGCWLVAKDICKKKYHYLCAISDGCSFNKKAYGVLCAKHKDDNVIPDPEIENDINNDYRKNAKDDELKDSTLLCSICVLTCDQDSFLQCSKCYKSVHSYCDDHQIIEDEDNETQDYICSKCKKEIVYQTINKGS